MIKKDSFYEFIPNQGLRETKETSEISYIDINLKTNNLMKIKPRKQGTLYSVSKRKNIFYIVTNANNAKKAIVEKAKMRVNL